MSDVADHDDTYDDEDDDDYDDEEEYDANVIPAAAARAVLDYLARSVVEDPDAVELDVDDRGGTVSLTVHVAPDDMGRVIGKRGRVANAIRTVVRAAAVRDDVEVEVEFGDD